MKNNKIKKAIFQFFGILTSRFTNISIWVSYLVKSTNFFNNQSIPFFFERTEYYKNIHDSIKDDVIVFLEFGVFKGESIRWWCNANTSPNSFFWGFDTFTGLPEDWNETPKGTFSTKGIIPSIEDSRVAFIVGLFSETLPKFTLLNSDLLRSNRLVIHLDADLYSSTFFVLIELNSYLKSGDIILFDEFFSFRNCDTEFKAFIDYLNVYGRKYDGVAKTLNQFCIKIL